MIGVSLPSLHQCASSVLMVRPKKFGFNVQTAATNSFQQLSGPDSDEDGLQRLALNEFDGVVSNLRDKGIEVIVAPEAADCHSPDAVFSNNWISFHHSGRVIIYPLMAANRRSEINQEVIKLVAASEAHAGNEIMDLRLKALPEQYLEGTGSLVFDHMRRIVYGCRSPRTDSILVEMIGRELGYSPVLFDATDSDGTPVYHTNVVMSIGANLVVACLDAIGDQEQRSSLKASLTHQDRVLLELDSGQMDRFCGNILQLVNKAGTIFTVVSSTTLHAFTPNQLAQIQSCSTLVVCDISTIEHYGGGSVRCMITEIF